MNEERVQRRLAAILAADIAGYSRLMRDEACSAYRGRDSHYWPPPAQIQDAPN